MMVMLLAIEADEADVRRVVARERWRVVMGPTLVTRSIAALLPSLGELSRVESHPSETATPV